MSSDTREVEVKYRVRDPEQLHAGLSRLGLVLTQPVLQDDQAYARAGWDYGMSKIGVPFGRLRTQDGRHLFTVKTPVDSELSCLEYESEVADRDQMHLAILAMGFTPTVRIVKLRRTARLDDEITLCIDDVDHLGTFLEVERIVDTPLPTDVIQDELDRLARSLTDDLEPVLETYDSLIRTATAAR